MNNVIANKFDENNFSQKKQNKKTLNCLYISIIRSVLEYSSTITPNMATSSLNKLTIIQNKAIKIINRQPIHTHQHRKLGPNTLSKLFLSANVHPMCKETLLCKYKTEIEDFI